MQLDSKLESYVQNVTSWWSWSIRLLKRGPETTANDMVRAFVAAGAVPAYRA